jgi:hypothetical protein
MHGRLSISPVGKCQLELMGEFGSLVDRLDEDNKDLSTIHGLVAGGPVTLYDCFWRNGNIGFGTVSRASLHVHEVFRGANLPPEAELRLAKLEAVVDGLDDWLQITGIEAGFELDEAHKVRSAHIRYTPQPKIEWTVPGLHVSIDFAWTAPGGGSLTEAKITHQAGLVVTPEAPLPLEELRQQLYRVVNFFSFATDQTLSVDSLTAFSPQATVQTPKGDEMLAMPVFYESTTAPSQANVRRDTWLFSFKDVSDRMQRMLTRWLAHHEEVAPAFNLFFAVRSGRHTYLESAFLSIAQSLETLHDRTSGRTQMPPAEFEALQQRILQSCPDADRDWLKEELRYANKPTLRSRLRSMLEPFESVFGPTKARNELVTQVVNTRNYYTHYDPALAELAARGAALLPLKEKLLALFQLQLLTMLEIDPEQIQRLIKSNRRLRYRLGLDSR